MSGTALRWVVLIACWTQCAAWQGGMKPMAVKSRSATAISMVQWDNAPQDVTWAQVAWNQLGLQAGDLGSECIFIPEELCPNPTANVRSGRGSNSPLVVPLSLVLMPLDLMSFCAVVLLLHRSSL